MEVAGQSRRIKVVANLEGLPSKALEMARAATKAIPMQSQNGPKPQENPEHAPAVEHISHARELLNALRKRIGEHPELAEAITKLETALSLLTLETGGML